MAANKTPEFDSVPLDTLVLQLKALGVQDLKTFPYLSKSNEKKIGISTERLYLMDCLDEDSKITSIGRLVMRIPIEPFFARPIVEAILVEMFSSNCQVGQSPASNKTHPLSYPKVKIVEKLIRTLARIINFSKDREEFLRSWQHDWNYYGYRQKDYQIESEHN